MRGLHPQRTSSLVLALTVGGLLSLATGASAQSVVTPGWNGYSPGYAWGSVSPSVGGAAVQPAGVVYYSTPSGWQGYAPAAAWEGYAPGAPWQYYTSGTANQSALSTPIRSERAGTPWYPGRPISASNREFGTGRNVHMIKPWLPESPS